MSSYEDEERKSCQAVIAAFKHYEAYSLLRVNKTEAYLNTLPLEHQEMLTQYRNHLNRIRDCIESNYRIVRKMIKNCDHLFQNSNDLTTTIVPTSNGRENQSKLGEQDVESVNINSFLAKLNLSSPDMIPISQDCYSHMAKSQLQQHPDNRIDPFKSLKVQITLKQFARDWSSDGEEERRQCYQPIIDAIVDFYNPDQMDVTKIKILVPGAGLGRLAYELAFRGYSCEGNEFSFFMLIASNFILNQCEIENQYTLYPWIHQFVNNVNRSDQIAPITFPDVSPTEAAPRGHLSMAAGDFLLVYKEPDSWDCVATCFFIDCANNVIDFVETIYKILKPGAIWVNLGPLLYHYSDVQDEFSIEPTAEDLLSIIENVGFEVMKFKSGIRTQYAQNPRSMLQSEYLSIFSVCRKPLAENNGIDKVDS